MNIKSARFSCLISFLQIASIIIANNTNAEDASPPQGLPSQLRFCALSRFTLIWNRDHYDAYNEEKQNQGVVSTYRIQEFRKDSIQIVREEKDGTKLLLSGMLAADGNGVMNGKMKRADGKPPVISYTLTWKTTDTLPAVLLSTAPNWDGKQEDYPNPTGDWLVTLEEYKNHNQIVTEGIVLHLKLKDEHTLVGTRALLSKGDSEEIANGAFAWAGLTFIVHSDAEKAPGQPYIDVYRTFKVTNDFMDGAVQRMEPDKRVLKAALYFRAQRLK